MTIRVGINGFGRIGRMVFRASIEEFDDIEVVAINDLLEPDYLAYMLVHDSVHGRFQGDVSVSGNNLVVNGKQIRLTAIKDPTELKWDEVNVDVVVESTGLFLTKQDCEKHIKAGARKVVMSAPSKDDTPMYVYGVNDKTYHGEAIISNASCTTNCLAPAAKVVNDKYGIVKAMMTTVHAYTNDQKILDLPHKDLRRARAAAMSIIPTTTGAAKAVGLVLPELQGKLSGMALRVPVVTGSVVDLTAELEKEASAAEVNAALKAAAESGGWLSKVMVYSEEPLVSTDIVGSPASCTVDALSTEVMGGNMAKVITWYDNEWGYASRLADLAAYVAERL